MTPMQPSLTALEIEARLLDMFPHKDRRDDHDWVSHGLEQNYIIEVEPKPSGVCQFEQSRSPTWTEVFDAT